MSRMASFLVGMSTKWSFSHHPIILYRTRAQLIGRMYEYLCKHPPPPKAWGSVSTSLGLRTPVKGYPYSRLQTPEPGNGSIQWLVLLQMLSYWMQQPSDDPPPDPDRQACCAGSIVDTLESETPNFSHLPMKIGLPCLQGSCCLAPCPLSPWCCVVVVHRPLKLEDRPCHLHRRVYMHAYGGLTRISDIHIISKSF